MQPHTTTDKGIPSFKYFFNLFIGTKRGCNKILFQENFTKEQELNKNQIVVETYHQANLQRDSYWVRKCAEDWQKTKCQHNHKHNAETDSGVTTGDGT